jgi:hypothetical protein
MPVTEIQKYFPRKKSFLFFCRSIYTNGEIKLSLDTVDVERIICRFG